MWSSPASAGHSDDDEATTLIFEALSDRDHPHGNAVVALWDDAEKLAVLIRAQQVIDELGATDLEDARRRLLK